MTNEEFINSIKLDGEEWRDVVGYEGLYKISSFGRIITLQKQVKRPYNDYFLTNPKLKKPQRSNTGYLRINLIKDGINKFYSLHRLVALTFIPNPFEYTNIDHIDCNKNNNCVTNLKWCTQSQNMLNPITRINNSMSKKNKRTEWACTSIVCLKDGQVVKTYPAIRDASLDGHVEQCVSRVCRGLRKTYHGYEWMYLEDYNSLVNKSKNSQSTLD